jgi:23S rRNA (guanosine2251-2'-O)-methyltransferase
MGQNPRARGRRSHRHGSPAAGIAVLEEAALYQVAERKLDPLFLILDCVQDPHNLGACLRTADAAGVDAVVIPRDRAAGLTEAVCRVACGAAEHVPLATVTNLARCLERLQRAGVWLVGTADEAKGSLYELDLRGSLGVVLGAEGTGLRRLTREHCDFLVQIPMDEESHVTCLNVSVAAGVVLFEARRQRTYGGGTPGFDPVSDTRGARGGGSMEDSN